MDLEIRQDDRFQTREWRVERIGWGLMSLFVVAGLVGLLGTGPLSWAASRGPLGLVEVNYQRVTHHEADDSITFRFSPDAIEGGAITVELRGSWVSGVDQQGAVPQPTDQSVIPGGVVFEIPANVVGETALTITFRPQAYGRLSADVTVNGDRTSFTQFVLP